MQNYKKDFIHFLLSVGSLQFGEFELKSHRKSPYYFNTSCFNTAITIETLGSFYASAIEDQLPGCTSIFGPAYKGIPLCLTSAMTLARITKKDIGYFFNRKEKKIHGDQSFIIGKLPTSSDIVVLVDDVITDGQTKIDLLKILFEEYNVKIDAVFVAFDRMEKSNDGKDAKIAFEQQTGIKVFAITNIREILHFLKSSFRMQHALCDESTLKAIEIYLAKYGVVEVKTLKGNCEKG